MEQKNIPIVDCPYGDYMIGDASGKLMNQYGRYPCKIMCGVYALLVRGTAHATINMTEYDFKTNDVLMLEPGSFFFIREFSNDALVYWIVFASKFLDRHAFDLRMSTQTMQIHSPIINVSEEQAKVLCQFYDTLVMALNAQPTMLDSEKMVHIFNLLQSSYAKFAKAKESEGQSKSAQDRKMELYQEYCSLVLKHYHEWHRVADYAKYMSLTMPHLCSSISSVSTHTAAELLADALLTDAKSQLKLTTTPIKEIAKNLGFENVAFFNRFFKSHVGITPKAYRQSD